MMPIRSIAKEFIVLAGLAVFSALVVNYFSPNGIHPLGDWDQSQYGQRVITLENLNSLEFEINNIYRAKEIFDSGQALFVDARATEFYTNGHIKGAISLPLGRFNERIQAFKKEYSANIFIVTYCSGKGCGDSHQLAQYLFEKGYTKVSVMTEGFLGWQGEGYPVE